MNHEDTQNTGVELVPGDLQRPERYDNEILFQRVVRSIPHGIGNHRQHEHGETDGESLRTREATPPGTVEESKDDVALHDSVPSFLNQVPFESDVASHFGDNQIQLSTFLFGGKPLLTREHKP